MQSLADLQRVPCQHSQSNKGCKELRQAEGNICIIIGGAIRQLPHLKSLPNEFQALKVLIDILKQLPGFHDDRLWKWGNGRGQGKEGFQANDQS